MQDGQVGNVGEVFSHTTCNILCEGEDLHCDQVLECRNLEIIPMNFYIDSVVEQFAHRPFIYTQEVHAGRSVRDGKEGNVVLDGGVGETRLRHDLPHGVKLLRTDHEIYVERVPRVAIMVDGKSTDQKAVNTGRRQMAGNEGLACGSSDFFTL